VTGLKREGLGAGGGADVEDDVELRKVGGGS